MELLMSGSLMYFTRCLVKETNIFIGLFVHPLQ